MTAPTLTKAPDDADWLFADVVVLRPLTDAEIAAATKWCEEYGTSEEETSDFLEALGLKPYKKPKRRACR